MRPLALLMAATMLAAGCLQNAPVAAFEEDLHPRHSELHLREARAGVGEAVTWDGRVLRADVGNSAACGTDNCDRVRFHLERGPERNATTMLQVTIAHDVVGRTGDFDRSWPSFRLDLVGPEGTLVARGGWHNYVAVVSVTDPEPGDYEASIVLTNEWPTRSTYRGALLLYEATTHAPETKLLPDLVINLLDDLTLEYARPGEGHMLGLPGVTAPWTQGCGIDEVVEQDAARCLRFMVSIGNVGQGPLRLGYQTSTAQMVTEETVPAQQCVFHGDGRGVLRDAGHGNYHLYHVHHHQQDILGFDVRAWDAERWEAKGEPLRSNQKFGFGFYAQGLVDEGRTPVWPFSVPLPQDCRPQGYSWYTLNPGWFDPYQRWRTGNMIDISGLPNGLYELSATVNPAGLVEESDLDNNVGRVVFELAGDDVTIVEPWRWGRAVDAWP